MASADEKKKRLLESLDRGPGTVWRNELPGGIIQEGTSRGMYPHGPYREWFSNGQLRLERGYRAGRLDGTCRQYAPDGRLLAEFTMSEGDGLLLEYWDTGSLKLRWWCFRVQDKPCEIREFFDIDGRNPVRSYTWKGRPCSTRKRFEQELEKCGLALPPPEKRDDPEVWAEFTSKARQAAGPAKRQ